MEPKEFKSCNIKQNKTKTYTEKEKNYCSGFDFHLDTLSSTQTLNRCIPLSAR